MIMLKPSTIAADAKELSPDQLFEFRAELMEAGKALFRKDSVYEKLPNPTAFKIEQERWAAVRKMLPAKLGSTHDAHQSPHTGSVLQTALAIVVLAISTYLALVFAPTELVMGDVQRVFYFHIGTAWTALLGFIEREASEVEKVFVEHGRLQGVRTIAIQQLAQRSLPRAQGSRASL